MMEEMVGDSEIELDSDLYNEGIDQFESAGRKHVTVIEQHDFSHPSDFSCRPSIPERRSSLGSGITISKTESTHV